LDDDPDLSYLEHEVDEEERRIVNSCAYSNEDIKALGWDTVKGYVEEDRERLAAFNRGNWWMVGIRAEAEILTGGDRGYLLINRIKSGGLWGVESDSDEAYFREVEEDELANLRDVLTELGFPAEEIDAAFAETERKEEA
jgi:hypothetical protein